MLLVFTQHLHHQAASRITLSPVAALWRNALPLPCLAVDVAFPCHHCRGCAAPSTLPSSAPLLHPALSSASVVSTSPFGATTPIFRPTCLVLLFCFLFASFGAVCQSPCLQHLQSPSLAEQEGGELGGLLVRRLARCVANRAAAPRTHVHVTSFCWQILLAAVRWQCAGHMQTCLSRDFPDRHSSPLLPERPMCP